MRIQRALLSATVIAGYSLAHANVVVVTPDDLQGWQQQFVTGSGGTLTATGGFESGPGSPPYGSGSYRFSVGANGDSGAQIRHPGYDGVRLADLTTLNYSTFVQQTGSGGQAVYIVLNIDLDANGTVDDLIFFEPLYQSADFFPPNPQGPLTDGVWQAWDALNGGWWSNSGFSGAGPGTDVKSIQHYLSFAPNAVIRNSFTGGGGVRLVAGFGAGAWDNFIGNADGLTIATASSSTTYDFESVVDSDGDGVPDDLDECPSSDLRGKVDVNGSEEGETSIDNVVDSVGCSIQDHVNEAAAGAKNHGAYIKAIKDLATRLQADGVISAQEKQEMITGATKSSVGK